MEHIWVFVLDSTNLKTFVANAEKIIYDYLILRSR